MDEALPIGKVDTLPDEGKYEGDMVLHEGAPGIWSNNDWIEVGGAVDTGDFATKVYANKVAAQFASVASTQVDWTNQTYSNGTWILQTGVPQTPNFSATSLPAKTLLTRLTWAKPNTSQSTLMAVATLFTTKTRSLATRCRSTATR